MMIRSCDEFSRETVLLTPTWEHLMELETTFSGFSPEILLLLRESRPSAVGFPSSSDIVPAHIANKRLSRELNGATEARLLARESGRIQRREFPVELVYMYSDRLQASSRRSWESSGHTSALTTTGVLVSQYLFLSEPRRCWPDTMYGHQRCTFTVLESWLIYLRAPVILRCATT